MKINLKIIIILFFIIGIAGKFYAQGSINLLGKLPYSGFPIHDVWGHTDSIGNDYALLCMSTLGMRVIDVTNPANPVQVGSISGGGVQPIDVKTWKNYAYVVAENVSVTGKIIDLTDPTTPVQVGTFPGGHNIWISDSGYLYLSAPGLRIFDLNPNPIVPALVYTDNSCTGHDAIINGNRLYDFSDNCGTNIYDISNPTSPSLLGAVTAPSIFHHSGWPSANENYVFICDELASPTENDITVWDISNLAAPFIVDSFADPTSFVHNMYVINNYAFVSYYRAGFRVFDITDPTNISLSAEYDTDSTASGPGYGGNFGLYTFWGTNKILASDESKGLYIFSFSEPTSVQELNLEEEVKVDVYPNPTSDKLTIEFDKKTAGQKIRIYNAVGKLMLSENINTKKVTLSVHHLPSGIYYVELYQNNSKHLQKLVITK